MEAVFFDTRILLASREMKISQKKHNETPNETGIFTMELARTRLCTEFLSLLFNS